MKLVYMAHPMGSATKAGLEGNLARAKRWFTWCVSEEVAVIADWIIYGEVWDDFDPKLRAIGLTHDDEMIRRCDEFWMVGGRISAGMERGKETATRHGLFVKDLTHLGAEPPEHASGW